MSSTDLTLRPGANPSQDPNRQYSEQGSNRPVPSGTQRTDSSVLREVASSHQENTSDRSAENNDRNTPADQAGAVRRDSSPSSIYANDLGDDDKTAIQNQDHLAAVGLAGGANPAPYPKLESGLDQALLGKRLEQFEIIDCIGFGGMGRVFRARDNRLDRLVAIKVLSPELSRDSEQAKRFELEAKSAARMSSPVFAQLFSFGQAEGLSFMAMEFVDGEDLRHRIQRLGKLPVAEVLDIAEQLARGLITAKQAGVVHRDIKPSNIIMTNDGSVKLVDLGLARVSASSEEELTQPGTTLGTYDYISPEQARDPRQADSRSDIYSLGCTLFHALTGKPPFPSGSALQKLISHHQDAPTDPRTLIADLPDPLVAMLLKMLEKDPNRRYSDPQAILTDLTAIQALMNQELPGTSGRSKAFLAVENLLGILVPSCLFLLMMSLVMYWTAPRPTGIQIQLRGDTRTAEKSERNTEPQTNENNNNQQTAASTSKPQPRVINVPASSDLVSVIQQAEAGSTLLLTDKSYRLPLADLARLVMNKELVIKSSLPNELVEVAIENQQFNLDVPDVDRLGFHIRSASVTFEGIHFKLRDELEDALFQVENGELKFNQCCIEPDDRTMPIDDAEMIGQGSPGPALIMLASSAGKTSSLRANRTLLRSIKAGIEISGEGLAQVEFDHFASLDMVGLIEHLGPGKANLTFRQATIANTVLAPLRSRSLSELTVLAQNSVFVKRPKGVAQDVGLIEGTVASNRLPDARWWESRGCLLQGYSFILSHSTSKIGERLDQMDFVGMHDQGSESAPNDSRLMVENADQSSDLNWPIELQLNERLREQRRGNSVVPGVTLTPWGNAYKPRSTDRVEKSAIASRTPQKKDEVRETKDSNNSSVKQPTAVVQSLLDQVSQARAGQEITLEAGREYDEGPFELIGKSLTIRGDAGRLPTIILDLKRASTNVAITLRQSAKLRLERVRVLVRSSDKSASSMLVGSTFTIDPDCQLELVECVVAVERELTQTQWSAVSVIGASSTNVSTRNTMQIGMPAAPTLIRLERTDIRVPGPAFNLVEHPVVDLRMSDSLVWSEASLLRVTDNKTGKATAISWQANTTTLVGSSPLIAIKRQDGDQPLSEIGPINLRWNQTAVWNTGTSGPMILLEGPSRGNSASNVVQGKLQNTVLVALADLVRLSASPGETSDRVDLANLPASLTDDDSVAVVASSKSTLGSMHDVNPPTIQEHLDRIGNSSIELNPPGVDLSRLPARNTRTDK